MVRENVRFQEGNFTSDDTYFYSMLDGSQVLQQKVDDGSVAFSYPLDTAIPGNIKELEWDGVYFWSLEDRAAANGVTIRKWGIQGFICQQEQKFDFIDGATHTYDSDSFAMEHYRLSVGVNDNGGGGYTKNLSTVHISDNTMLEPGDVLTFVRRFTSAAQRVGTSFVEQATVQTTVSGSTTQVQLTAPMSGDPHGDGKGFRGPNVDTTSPDEVFITKHIWLANDNSPGNPGTPSIYKIRASNGSNLVQFSGTQYDDINGMANYNKMDLGPEVGDASLVEYNNTVEVDNDAGGRQTYILLARGSTLLFYNVSTNVIDRSLIMNNIQTDTITEWNIADMWVGGLEPDVVLYRLQDGTTYKNESLVLVDESWSEFNYEKQLLRRVVNSIAITADPSIIPADGISDSQITVTLRDQYNDLAPALITVTLTEDATGGSRLSDTTPETDAFGQAKTVYTAGSTEQDVKITATVTDGLI